MWGFDDWANFGIAGMVILSLFLTLKFVVSSGLEKYEKIMLEFTNTIRTLDLEHRQDRKDWHEAAERKAEIEKLNQDRRDESQERRDEALRNALDGFRQALENDRRSRWDDHRKPSSTES